MNAVKPRYITQLTADDIARMIRGGNCRSGDGVRVEVKNDGLEFSIDQQRFKEMVWAFVRNSMNCTCTYADIQNVSCDPGQVS